MKGGVYDPHVDCTTTAGPFSYPVPREDISRRNRRLIRKAARRERPRLLSLPPGEKSPMLAGYEKSCHLGEDDVHRCRAGYARDELARYHRAQAFLDGPRPEVIPPPQGQPPTDGRARQEWDNDMRRAAASRAAADAHDKARREAWAMVEDTKTNLKLIDYLAGLALANWRDFCLRLWQMHLHEAIGGNTENPTLRSITYGLLPPAPAAPVLALGPGPEPSDQDGSTTPDTSDHESPTTPDASEQDGSSAPDTSEQDGSDPIANPPRRSSTPPDDDNDTTNRKK